MTGRVLVSAVVAVLLCCCAYAAPTLTLIPPGGGLTGSPNQVIGWGYTITNDTSDWLLFTNSLFCNAGGDPNSADCTTPGTGPTSFGPQFGVYTDYIAAAGIEVAPNSTIGPTAFSPGAPGTGVGQYKVNAGALNGQMDAGNLFITYNEFIGDPFNGGSADPADPGNLELFAAASATVTGAVSIPEPSSLLLIAAPLFVLAGTGIRRRRRA